MRNIANFEVISLPGGPGKDYLIVIVYCACLELIVFCVLQAVWFLARMILRETVIGIF